jgi:CheY-like chemotaxis protein
MLDAHSKFYGALPQPIIPASSVNQCGRYIMTMSNMILLVDDSEEDAELTARALHRSNALNEIVVITDGVEALDYLFGRTGDDKKEPKGAPALIVLDLHMPKIGGLELLRRLRAAEPTRRTPVLILSGTKDERDVVASHDLGANRFIAKPLDVTQFAAAARQLGLHRLVAAAGSTVGEALPRRGVNDKVN